MVIFIDVDMYFIFVLQTMIEVFREVFQWPKYVNTATFVASLISLFILIILDIVNNKLIARIKLRCCLYSSQNKKCHTSKRFPFPLRIPIALVLVGYSRGCESVCTEHFRMSTTIKNDYKIQLDPVFILTKLE